MGQMPTLTTTRLILRPFTLDDAPTVRENVGKWDVARTIPNMPHPYEEGMAEEWIGTHAARYDNGEGISLAITLRADGLLIGGVGLRINAAFRSAEIGYWVSPARWDRGTAPRPRRFFSVSVSGRSGCIASTRATWQATRLRAG